MESRARCSEFASEALSSDTYKDRPYSALGHSTVPISGGGLRVRITREAVGQWDAHMSAGLHLDFHVEARNFQA